MVNNLSIAVYGLPMRMLTSFYVGKVIQIFVFIINHHRHHHHHVVPLARISLTLSRHFSLSFIPSGRSSGLHPVSSHSCCMYVLAGRSAFARPYVGVHRSTSLMSSSPLLKQGPASMVRLIWIVFVMGGRWPYSSCFVGCYRQDLFNIALNIIVLLPSSFFSSRFVSVQVVHPYSSIDTTAVWKKLRFIFSVRFDFHMIDSLSITVHALVACRCLLSTTSQILTIRRILEGVRAKNLQVTLLFVDFTKAFDSINRGKMEQIILAYGVPKWHSNNDSYNQQL